MNREVVKDTGDPVLDREWGWGEKQSWFKRIKIAKTELEILRPTSLFKIAHGDNSSVLATAPKRHHGIF